eukprot:3414220-Prymnesium_polylepis.1
MTQGTPIALSSFSTDPISRSNFHVPVSDSGLAFGSDIGSPCSSSIASAGGGFTPSEFSGAARPSFVRPNPQATPHTESTAAFFSLSTEISAPITLKTFEVGYGGRTGRRLPPLGCTSLSLGATQLFVRSAAWCAGSAVYEYDGPQNLPILPNHPSHLHW